MNDRLGIVTTFIHNIVVYNIPLLYGTVGEILIEKSGSLNLGVEGIMAVGAIFGYIVGCYANSLLVGVLAAFLTAALCGLLFAVLTVSLQANQNITGLTLTTFGLGVYFFVGNGLKAVSWPAMADYSGVTQGFADLPIPGLSQIPVIGEGFFDHNILVYLAVVIALVMWWYMNRTTPGLRLRAVGENPGAADSVGINVVRMRYLAYILSGVLAGIGGAYMSMGYVSWFARDMTSGRGFIALAASAMGRSTPVGTTVASLLFGFTMALSNSMQTLSIPYELVEAVPYACTIVALSVYAYHQVRKSKKARK